MQASSTPTNPARDANVGTHTDMTGAKGRGRETRAGGVLYSAGSLATDAKDRSLIYVSIMESYLGRRLSRPMRYLAIAAVSGVAVTTAVAAKAGSFGVSEKQSQAQKDLEHELSTKLTELEHKYDELLRHHESAMSATTFSEAEMVNYKLDHENMVAKHTIELSEAESAVGEGLQKLAVFEKMQQDAEDIISASVAKVTALEAELDANKRQHESEFKNLTIQKQSIEHASDAKSAQIKSLEDELHAANQERQELRLSLKDFAARISARDTELENLRTNVNDHQTNISSLREVLSKRETEGQEFKSKYEEHAELLTKQHAHTDNLQLRLTEHENEVQKTRNIAQSLQDELAKANQDIENLKNKHSEDMERLEHEKAESIQQAQTKATELENKLAATQSKATEAQEEHLAEVTKIRTNHDKLEQELKLSNSRQESLSAAHDGLLNSNAEYQTHIENTENEVQEMKSSHEKTVESMKSEASEKLSLAQETAAIEQQNLRQAKEKLATELEEMKTLHAQELENTQNLQRAEMTDIEESHASEIEYMKKTIDDVRKEIADMKTTLTASAQSLSSVTKEKQKLEEAYKGQLLSKEKAISELEVQAKTQSNSIAELEKKAKTQSNSIAELEKKARTTSVGSKDALADQTNGRDAENPQPALPHTPHAQDASVVVLTSSQLAAARGSPKMTQLRERPLNSDSPERELAAKTQLPAAKENDRRASNPVALSAARAASHSRSSTQDTADQTSQKSHTRDSSNGSTQPSQLLNAPMTQITSGRPSTPQVDTFSAYAASSQENGEYATPSKQKGFKSLLKRASSQFKRSPSSIQQ